jgi:hypothetical protein
MKKILFAVPAVVVTLCSFAVKNELKGVWEYAGGVYNGKADSASKDYNLHRKYDASHYEAFLIEPGQLPLVYERGDYTLKTDSCLETQTYSRQPSKVTGVTVHYAYRIKNDTLTFNGTLPNGTTVQEYWKRVK